MAAREMGATLGAGEGGCRCKWPLPEQSFERLALHGDRGRVA